MGLKSPRSLRPLAFGAGALAASLGAGPVLAEVVDARPPVLESVIVTHARPNLPSYVDPAATYKADHLESAKFTEPLVDTPKSVAVIPEDLYDDLGATTFRDLMRTQPGVTLGTGEGGNAYGDRIFIRGFDARGDVYIDGVRDPGVGARELFDVEQVEILKGPASTIGGRGTTGGAVNIVSRQPLMSNFNDFENTVGTDGLRRSTIDVNRRLSDTLQVRVDGMFTESGTAGREALFSHRWGWAASAAWRPLPSVKLAVDYYHLSGHDLPDFGVPYDLRVNRPFDVPRDNFYGLVHRDFRETFADVYTARMTWDVAENIQVQSLARVGQTLNAYTASAPERPDPVAGTVAANPKRRDALSSSWAEQTSLTARFNTGPLAHTLVAGFEISGETVLNRGRAFVECATLPCTGTGSAILQSLLSPDPYRAVSVVDTGITTRTTGDVQSRAGYVLDTIKLGRWALAGGLRYDSFDLNFKQLTVATRALVRRANDVGFWNSQASLTYKPAKNGTLYAAFATSSNPSGEQLDATALDYGGLDARTQALEPERNKAYEVGAKWNVANEHLLLTAALFQVDKTNARVQLDANTVVLGGRQRSKGFELGASGKITPRWDLFAGFTYVDAKIVDSPTASQIGAQFPNTAKVSWSVTTKYKLIDRLTLGTTVTHESRRFGGTVAAQSTSIPGFTRVDLFGTIQITRTFALDVNLLNATDKVYYDALYRSATPFTYIAPGRSFTVKADWHF